MTTEEELFAIEANLALDKRQRGELMAAEYVKIHGKRMELPAGKGATASLAKVRRMMENDAMSLKLTAAQRLDVLRAEYKKQSPTAQVSAPAAVIATPPPKVVAPVTAAKPAVVPPARSQATGQRIVTLENGHRIASGPQTITAADIAAIDKKTLANYAARK